jgi:hypothetical protein
MASFAFRAILIGAWACALPAQTPFTVTGKANIYAAGSGASGDGEAPFEIKLPSARAQAVEFVGVSGVVGNGVTTNGPDGRIALGSQGADVMAKAIGTLIRAEGGLAPLAVLHRYTFLTGVFLGPNLPPQAPPGLIFDDRSSAEIVSPELGQTFFVGSGLTEGGKPRVFRIPEGAARLFLGISDVCDINGFASPACYGDNTGSFSGEVTFLVRSCKWVSADARQTGGSE